MGSRAGVRRVSKYGSFSPDQKIEFLSHMAYDLTISTRKSVFEESDLLRSYENIHRNFGLDISQRQEVIAEIESHTGLFLRSGFQKYEFMHKSIQEYLTAEYIVRLPFLPDMNVIKELGSEMAIAVAISSNPSAYITGLRKQIRQNSDLPSTFFSVLVYRLQVENPTFDCNDEVVITFLDLRTRLINNGREPVNYLPPRRMRKEDVDTFYMTLSLVPESRTREVLYKYFRKSPGWASEGGQLVTARGAREIDGITVIAPTRLL
jgi:hypothetical protein